MMCAGKPDKATIESAANVLKIPEKQVSECRFFSVYWIWEICYIKSVDFFRMGGRSVLFLFWPQLQVATRAMLSVLSVAMRSCDRCLLLFVTKVTRQLCMFVAEKNCVAISLSLFYETR